MTEERMQSMFRGESQKANCQIPHMTHARKHSSIIILAKAWVQLKLRLCSNSMGILLLLLLLFMVFRRSLI